MRPARDPLCALSIASAVLAACAASGPPQDATTTEAPAPTAAARTATSTAVDELVGALTDDASPGYAVMVVQRGQVLHQAGYGLADLERNVLIDPVTSIRLGSVGKQFTAMAVLILVDRGALGLDDPVAFWVPEIGGRYGPGVTVRHLLNHTGGLPDYYDEVEESWSGGMPTNSQAAAIYETWGEPRFAPNDRYEYSNPGYELLALVVMRASGQHFAPFMEEHVFAPLGMTRSLVLDTPGEHFEGRAYGYRRRREGGFRLNDDHTLNLLFGAGGIYSTLEDLYRWDQAHWSSALISPELQEAAFTPATLNDGSRTDYGFGWGVDEDHGQKVVRHSGGWVGFLTHIARYLDDELTVVVLSNRGDSRPGRLAGQIADLYLGAEPAE